MTMERRDYMQVNIFEAKNRLSQLIKSVQAGEEVVIANRGEPVAQLAMPEPLFLQAAQLRARFSLRTPDALHLSCAQHHRCAALWTNDDRLAQASHGLARNILR